MEMYPAGEKLSGSLLWFFSFSIVLTSVDILIHLFQLLNCVMCSVKQRKRKALLFIPPWPRWFARSTTRAPVLGPWHGRVLCLEHTLRACGCNSHVSRVHHLQGGQNEDTRPPSYEGSCRGIVRVLCLYSSSQVRTKCWDFPSAGALGNGQQPRPVVPEELWPGADSAALRRNSQPLTPLRRSAPRSPLAAGFRPVTDPSCLQSWSVRRGGKGCF